MDEATYKKELALRINEVLHYIWDPIGVSDTPEARNEYDSYADQVWRLVLGGKSKTEISAILTKIATERMGLEPKKEYDDRIAEIVLDWARFLRNPYE